jgi:polyferredoxin
MSNDTAVYSWLADTTLMLHLAFVVFVAGGQMVILAGWARGWKWTRHLALRLAHLVAITYVALAAWFGAACPLTVLEAYWRRRAGETGYEMSFVGYWVQRLLFYSAPEWVFTLIYTLFAALVVATFVGYPPRRRCKTRLN